MEKTNQTKVTIVTGPLGAGKTTLLKDHGIKHYKEKSTNLEDKIKLIVNDAALGNQKGAFHTDGRRLSSQLSQDELEMYGQSCVCCDGLTTFETALEKLKNTKYFQIESRLINFSVNFMILFPPPLFLECLN